MSSSKRKGSPQEEPDNAPAQEIQPEQAEKRRRKSRDGAWTKGSETRRARSSTAKIQSMVHMRSNTQSQVVDETGEIVDLKTAYLVHPDLASSELTPRRLSQRLEANLAGVKSKREISEIIRDEHGSPIMVITPMKQTKLYRHKNFGFISVYTNIPQQPSPKKAPQIKPDFAESKQAGLVKKPASKIKYQTLVITPELLEQLKKTRKMKGNKRSKSQNRVLARTAKDTKSAGATPYANAALGDEATWEWLHLIAYSLLHELSQDEKNLVGGKSFANSDMMFAEEVVKKLTAKFPTGITVKCTARLIEDTQIGHNMDYVIETQNFVLPFRFNLQTQHKPHIVIQDYLNALLETLTEKDPIARNLQSQFMEVDESHVEKLEEDEQSISPKKR